VISPNLPVYGILNSQILAEHSRQFQQHAISLFDAALQIFEMSSREKKFIRRVVCSQQLVARSSAMQSDQAFLKNIKLLLGSAFLSFIERNKEG
jgi:hypothetical protein